MSELERLLRERMSFYDLSSVAQDYVLKAFEETRKEFPSWDSIERLYKNIPESTEKKWLIELSLNHKRYGWFVRWFGAAAPAVHGHRSSGTEQSVEDTAPHER